MEEELQEALQALADTCANELDKHVHVFLIVTYSLNNVAKLRLFYGKSRNIDYVYCPNGLPPKSKIHDYFFEYITSTYRDRLPKSLTTHMFSSWGEFRNFVRLYGSKLFKEVEP